MTRRWSLIALIVALAVALTFVLVNIRTGTAADRKTPTAAVTTHQATSAPKGIDWWRLNETSGTVAADRVGHRDATLTGGASWTTGPHGGALKVDGHTGYADTGATVLDTAHSDFSVAAWVRLDDKSVGEFYTAVSEDSDQASVFYLQYSGQDKRFAFSFTNARAIAVDVGDPLQGRWYHLVGTYSQADGALKLYVDGKLSGNATSHNVEFPTRHMVIGRAKFQGRPTDFWNGSIADVHAYERVLSASEAAALAANEPS